MRWKHIHLYAKVQTGRPVLCERDGRGSSPLWPASRPSSLLVRKRRARCTLLARKWLSSSKVRLHCMFMSHYRAPPFDAQVACRLWRRLAALVAPLSLPFVA